MLVETMRGSAAFEESWRGWRRGGPADVFRSPDCVPLTEHGVAVLEEEVLQTRSVDSQCKPPPATPRCASPSRRPCAFAPLACIHQVPLAPHLSPTACVVAFPLHLGSRDAQIRECCVHLVQGRG